MRKVAVWTDVDLDGAASYLVLKWLVLEDTDKVELHTCSPSKLRVEFDKWLENHSLYDYDKVIFLDLDTTPIHVHLDKANVEIYDHHESHMPIADKYIIADAYVRNEYSTAELIYEVKKTMRDLTAAQKNLIKLVSDYDSYKLELADTKNLNYLFWTYTGNRVEKFATEFKDGFTGFTALQNNAIALQLKKRNEIISNLKIYVGKINDYTVISTFCDNMHNDVADYIIQKYDIDIVMLVNPKIQTVSFRKNLNCTADLSVIADRLCEGGGHTNAAGGKITNDFLTFSKTLIEFK